MDYYKELNLAHSKSKPQWWRMGLIWGFIVAFGFINFSCKKNSISNDQYYVKYVVKSIPDSASQVKSSLDSVSRVAYIRLENSVSKSVTFNDTYWEMTIDSPVKKGFKAFLNASFHNYSGNIDVEIYISKNNAPFILKSSNISKQVRTSASTNYKIK